MKSKKPAGRSTTALATASAAVPTTVLTTAPAADATPQEAADSSLDSLPALDLTTVSGFIVPAQGSHRRLERLLSARRKLVQRPVQPTFDSTVY